MHLPASIAALAAYLLAASACPSKSTVADAVAGDTWSQELPGNDALLDDSADADADADAAAPGMWPELWVTRGFDAAAAARGKAWLTTEPLVAGLIPPEALRHLYLTWPLPLLDQLGYFQDEDSYWQAFHERYGTYAAPFDNAGWPLGVRVGSANLLYLDCLVCHAGPVGAATVPTIGAPNRRFNLELLYDDLQALPQAVQTLKATPLPEPYATLIANAPLPEDAPKIEALEGRTAAPGLNDAFGLGVTLSPGATEAGINTRFGVQDPQAWWTLRFKDRMYVDGSGQVGGHRAMMATLLAYDSKDWVAVDGAFEDIRDYLLSVAAPESPYLPESPETAATVEAGAAVYQSNCAGCHGGVTYPNITAEVGTDPIRSQRFGQAEADHINGLTVASEHAMTPQEGYLAPPLIGVWATAPYFHNGSVPDLVGVLNTAERPALWRMTGGYDNDRVGVSWVPEPGGVDIEREGLSNQGHAFGDALSGAERADLLRYLKTL